MQVTIKELGQRFVENDQNNPIRWMLMHRVGENEYYNTTDWFKCKDYFNDFVAYKHLGCKFERYGMHSNWAQFYENGLYVLVNNITSSFPGNVERVCKPFFDKWECSVTVTPYKEGMCMLYFSENCLKNTYRISVLTLFIRGCNTVNELASYESIFDKSFATSGSLGADVYKMLQAGHFDCALQYIPGEPVWYVDHETHSMRPFGRNDDCYIHNCGMISWLNAEGTYNSYEHSFIRTLRVVNVQPPNVDEMFYEEDEEECEDESEECW